VNEPIVNTKSDHVPSTPCKKTASIDDSFESIQYNGQMLENGVNSTANTGTTQIHDHF